MINNRIFGASISDKVQEELEKRQSETGEIQFGDSVKIPQATELNSRTPFIRMWTGVQTGVYEGEDDIVLYECKKIEGFKYSLLSKLYILSKYDIAIYFKLKKIERGVTPFTFLII